MNLFNHEGVFFNGNLPSPMERVSKSFDYDSASVATTHHLFGANTYVTTTTVQDVQSAFMLPFWQHDIQSRSQRPTENLPSC
ncbi:hypothetical protein DASC09_027660 [Saccharomycopsis crataegensis]|uniref:Uncharacterized protein n=1 Tax=Saccharomycopsis crataegensis TaxID=43959 RepID=A0AAV5QL70_9ASCO|nr:hypothetical protein DASC09_027660 [Saccharomycopsis crataegensis]